MGRVKPGKPPKIRSTITETHEPPEPLPGWPQSHVNVELTGDDDFECVSVTIHGVKHLVHASTAQELNRALTSALKTYNITCAQFGMPKV